MNRRVTVALALGLEPSSPGPGAGPDRMPPGLDDCVEKPVRGADRKPAPNLTALDRPKGAAKDILCGGNGALGPERPSACR